MNTTFNSEDLELVRIYSRVKQAARQGGQEAVESLFAGTDWKNVSGPPDTWFNLAVSLEQSGLILEATEIYHIALEQYPNEVDLLCGVLQRAYSTFAQSDLEYARSIWQRLDSMEQSKRYWRYWVFGARLHIKLGEDEKAFSMLQEGLQWVPADDLADVYRTFGSFFASSIIGYGDDRATSDDAEERRTRLLHVENILREGIERRVDEGYTIAQILAQLIQRRATSTSGDERRQVLEEALDVIDIAHATYYWSGTNHMLEDILYEKSRILVALGRYGEALPLLRTLEASDDFGRRMRDLSENARVMRVLCEGMLGIERPRSLSFIAGCAGNELALLPPSAVFLASEDVSGQQRAQRHSGPF